MGNEITAVVGACTGNPIAQAIEDKNQVALADHPELHGIIDQLTEAHGGNVHDLGIVTITSKSVYRNLKGLHPRNVADFKHRSSFTSSHEESNQWICFDFHERRVCMDKYTLASVCIAGVRYIETWVTESSLDGNTWSEVDHHLKDDAMHGGAGTSGDETLVIASFRVKRTEPFRFLRFRMTAKTTGRDELRRQLRNSRGELMYTANGEPVTERAGPSFAGSNSLQLIAFEIHGTITEG
jgi:hypothetical protein